MGKRQPSKAMTIASLALVLLAAGCDGSSGSGSKDSTSNGGTAAGAVLSSSPPSTLGAGQFPSLAVSQDAATVAWTKGEPGHLRVRSQTSAGSWGPTKTLGSGGNPVVASNRDGATVVAWERRQAGGYRLMVARRSAHGPWRDAVVLYRVPSPRLINGLHVDVSDNGAAAVWWEEL